MFIIKKCFGLGRKDKINNEECCKTLDLPSSFSSLVISKELIRKKHVFINGSIVSQDTVILIEPLPTEPSPTENDTTDDGEGESGNDSDAHVASLAF